MVGEYFGVSVCIADFYRLFYSPSYFKCLINNGREKARKSAISEIGGRGGNNKRGVLTPLLQYNLRAYEKTDNF